MTESTITIKGQSTLPKSVREALKIEPGDRLRYVILDDGPVRLMRTRPVAEQAAMQLVPPIGQGASPVAPPCDAARSAA